MSNGKGIVHLYRTTGRMWCGKSAEDLVSTDPVAAWLSMHTVAVDPPPAFGEIAKQATCEGCANAYHLFHSGTTP